ncbi:MAG TPA: M56 family metallopeptidase [Thermoanaerobaculia bacterium]|nr:M56 family metallopeptidase [Thermoanaerobaculia bacterium]
MIAGWLVESRPLAELAGRAVLDSLWQVALIAAGYSLFARLASSPRGRHAAAVLALAACVAAPIGTALSSTRREPSPRAGVATLEGIVEPSANGASAARTPTAATSPPLVNGGVLPWLGYGWVIGMSVFIVRLMGGALRVQALRRRASPAPQEVAARVEALASRIGLRRAPCIAESTRVDVPCVLGALRPIVLIPVALATGMPPLQLDTLLLHELAHVRRRDYLVNLLQSIAETLLFYHPAAWWLSRQARIERELCCDDLVIAAGSARADYASALVRLEGRRAARLVAAAGPTRLLARVRRIVGIEEQPRLPSRSIAGPLVAVAAVILAVVLVDQVAAEPAEEIPVELETWVLAVEPEALAELEVDWWPGGIPGRDSRFAVGVAGQLDPVIDGWNASGTAELAGAPRIVTLSGVPAEIHTVGRTTGQRRHKMLTLDLAPEVRGSTVELIVGVRLSVAETPSFGYRDVVTRLLWRASMTADAVALVEYPGELLAQGRRTLILIRARPLGDPSARSGEAAKVERSKARLPDLVSVSLRDAELGQVLDSIAKEYSISFALEGAAQPLRSTRVTAELEQVPVEELLGALLRISCLEGEERRAGVWSLRVAGDRCGSDASRRPGS